VSKAKEFENIKLRPEEQDEMNKLMKGLFVKLGNVYKPTAQDKGIEKDSHEKVYEDYEKVFALIQGYLMHCEYENSSLVADTIYIVQNCMRILRCMLEICMKKNMAHCVHRLLYWCKLIENKMMPDDNPLYQFCYENNMSNYSVMKSRKESKEGLLATDLVDRLMNAGISSLDDIRTYQADELSNLIGLKGRGQIVKKFASYIPLLNVEWNIRPIAQTILKMTVNVTVELSFTSRWHNRVEPFWVIVDDEVDILHAEQINIPKKSILEKTPVSISFFIPYRDDNNRTYRIVVDSDRWIGSTYEEVIDMESIVVNQEHMEYTRLLDLQPLPKSALNNPVYEKLYKFDYFNPVQTQVFHALYHTDNNVLIGAPTGSGKTNMAELAILRMFNKYPEKKIIYIAPLKAIAKERLADWKERLENGPLQKKVLELTGDYTPDLDALKRSDILITTPEKWDGISRNWQNRSYVQNVGLIVFDEIHLLGQDRGPVLEVIVSRMNYISQETSSHIRMVGLSTALANGVDVANWFGVKPQYFFNFKPQVRPCPIEIHFEGFSEKHYCPRMATMNKPAYNAIKKFSDGKPVLIFVSSRRQTRLTALDLIALIAADMNAGLPMTQFLNMSSQELDVYLEHINDPNLKQTLAFGIGMHHAGLVTSVIIIHYFYNF
jgi:Superfamily II helicase